MFQGRIQRNYPDHRLLPPLPRRDDMAPDPVAPWNGALHLPALDHLQISQICEHELPNFTLCSAPCNLTVAVSDQLATCRVGSRLAVPVGRLRASLETRLRSCQVSLSGNQQIPLLLSRWRCSRVRRPLVLSASVFHVGESFD